MEYSLEQQIMETRQTVSVIPNIWQIGKNNLEE